jgi:hypothetical protein
LAAASLRCRRAARRASVDASDIPGIIVPAARRMLAFARLQS